MNDLLVEAELPVELQRAGLHDDGPRSCAGLGGFVDDANGNTEASQPQRERKPGRAGANNRTSGFIGGSPARLLPAHDASTEILARNVNVDELGWNESSSTRDSNLCDVARRVLARPPGRRRPGGQAWCDSNTREER